MAYFLKDMHGLLLTGQTALTFTATGDKTAASDKTTQPSPTKSNIAASAFWFSGVDWSRWWNWAWNWVNIAWNKINAVPNPWRRWVLQNGLRMATGGTPAYLITRYYRSQGLYCPDKPWWLWLPAWLEPAWPVLTCAELRTVITAKAKCPLNY